MKPKALWIAFGLTIAVSFAVLGYYGHQIYQQAAPIPTAVVSSDGTILWHGEQIHEGQAVWRSIGGHQLGTLWGHGSYVAPDWSADWLHREALYLLERWARRDHGKPYEALDAELQAALQARLRRLMRANGYDPNTGKLVLPAERAEAVRAVARYYQTLFGSATQWPEDIALLADGGYSPAQLREMYAMRDDTVPDPRRREALSAFFFWAAWACVAERPAAGGDDAGTSAGLRPSYTNNWPPDPVIGNHPTGPIIVWSIVSVVLLLAGIGALAWYYATASEDDELVPSGEAPPADPLASFRATPSMRATAKFFTVALTLFVVQIALGGITAHYGVEGQGFYGIPLAGLLPYSVTRTWHVQSGIFWIATTWLATGLCIAPIVSGREPRGQHLGVNLLFVALLIVVLGTLLSTWLGPSQRLSLAANFWFGHQGYEYVDLGRFWQVLLFVGLLFWFLLMLRAMWPAVRQPGQQRQLLAVLLIASAAIGGFYAAGLMWGQRTHLAMVEYWRWWVVHLWVEGFFEVFATVVIAFLFARMGLVRVAAATRAVLFSSTVFLAGGIIGTFHHLYFTTTPTAVLALGAVFSALEVVPLVLMGYEAYHNFRVARIRDWVRGYRWPIYFFVAVAFWNLVGAGLFGFFINPPIALYYMQGLNTTPVHGHTALFGVYGMLGLGLTLFCLKALDPARPWREGLVRYAFWALNGGLALMVLLSLLPVGVLQTLASISHGLWYARSAEFQQQPVLDLLRWLRMVGDLVFASGALALVWFVYGLRRGWSYAPAVEPRPAAQQPQPEPLVS